MNGVGKEEEVLMSYTMSQFLLSDSFFQTLTLIWLMNLLGAQDHLWVGAHLAMWPSCTLVSSCVCTLLSS